MRLNRLNLNKMRKLNVDFSGNISKFESAMRKRFLLKTAFYKKVFRGKGAEFEGYRNYTESDDASLIDWKATMRANELLIKQYSEQRDLKVFFIIDVGEGMVFGSGEHLKNEIASEIAVCLAHLIVVSGDSIGFSLFNEKTVSRKMFSPGLKQFYILEENLKNPAFYQGESNLKKVLKDLSLILKDVSAVFIISDFIRTDKEDLKALREFSMKYETIGIMVRDPVDVRLPDLDREVIIEDSYTGKQLLINPSLIKYEYEKNVLEQMKEVENIFKKTRSDLLIIYTDSSFIAPLVNFLKLRIKSRRVIVYRR